MAVRSAPAGGRLEAVVPTVGASPHLAACLEALAADGVAAVVVHQGSGELPVTAAWLEDLGHRSVSLATNRGFAAATNRGIEETAGEFFATVNDDAIVQPGWSAALVSALAASPAAAAAQGSNLRLDDPERLDGRGLAWNRWEQAVQVGHGEPPPRREEPEEVFGVSATAAVYRRRALEQVAGSPFAAAPFAERLEAYYEDAELAVRLRRAGWSALWVPAARALHAGSATGDRRRVWRAVRLYGNRWPVAARRLGRRFPGRAPRMALRDLADLGGRVVRLDFASVAGIVGGWLRALRLLPGSVHRGEACR